SVMQDTAKSYMLKDSKGDWFGGKVGGGGYSFTPGLFGLGGGTKIGDAPWGTVPLTIARDGENIKISWDAAKAPGAQIYVLTGDGTGKFQKNVPADWKLYADSSIAGQFNAGSVATGILYHNKQVGAAVPSGYSNHGEAYYYGLQAGVTPTTPCQDPLYTGKTCFEVAPAVGKVNVPIFKASSGDKYTRFSFPLIVSNNELNEAVGNQLHADASPSKADQILEWSGSKWNVYYLDSTKGWTSLSGDPFGMVFGEGFAAFIIKRASQTTTPITVVGAVKADQFKIADTYKNLAKDTYTIFANPFPKYRLLNEANFAPSGAVANDSPAKSDQILVWTGDSWTIKYLSTTGWQQLSGSAFEFSPGIGYTYLKGGANTGPNGFNWTLNP
ncbi:MAG: hypothetical protein KKF06_01505, partial [Candidatus Margulisbacteria bacterium]|nr:hypothetical protein [Candidatus Margulisiibacteriota bacterium]